MSEVYATEYNGLCLICSAPRNKATHHCLNCKRAIGACHGWPKYEGEIKTENFVGYICYLCLIEASISAVR